MSRHTFAFFFSFHSAKPPLSPSFHPHSLVSDIRSVLGGCSCFSRCCCYLIIVLSSHRCCGSRAPGVSRNHLDSAVELGYPDRNSRGHSPHRFLAIAQWFVHLSAYPQPMEQYRQLSSHGNCRSFLGIFSSSQSAVPISVDHCLLQKAPECRLPATIIVRRYRSPTQ
jgi:hypothetical protein